MKKSIQLLTIGMILALCAGFASCGGGSSSSSSSSSTPSGSTSTSTSTSSSTPELTELSAPQNLQFYSEDSGSVLGVSYILTWDKVEDAEGYVVSVDGNEIETDKLKCNLYDYLTEGERSEILVKAKGDGIVYSDSEETEYEVTPKHVTAGLSYEYDSAMGGYLVSRGKSQDKNIVFPDFVMGFPIVGVAALGFLESNIESVVISATIKKIDDMAFQLCSNLTSVVFEESDEPLALGGSVFLYSGIKKITLPKRLTEMNNFRGFTGLEEINVHEENPYYTSIDGNVYSKDKTVFYKYAGGKTAEEFVIPEFVQKIDGAAFRDCEYLKKITFPNSIQSLTGVNISNCPHLESIAFGQNTKEVVDLVGTNCPKLTFLEIPGGVIKVGGGIGDDVEQLVIPVSIEELEIEQTNASLCVYFKGTQEEWNEISLTGEEFATVYFYSEDEPEGEGNFWHYNSAGEIEVWE